MASFYTDFAAGYGTLWLLTFGFALVTQSHINLGVFGMFGFPVIALLYALFRMPGRRAARERLRELEFRSEVLDNIERPLAARPFPLSTPPDAPR